MIENPVRIYGYSHLHLSTFSCYSRKPLRGAVRAGDLFAEALDAVRECHSQSEPVLIQIDPVR
jgi:hypothetical protein